MAIELVVFVVTGLLIASTWLLYRLTVRLRGRP